MEYEKSKDDAVRQMELEQELEASERNNNPLKLSKAAFKEMLCFIENRFPSFTPSKTRMDQLREIYMGKDSAYTEWVTKYKAEAESAAEPKNKKAKLKAKVAEKPKK